MRTRLPSSMRTRQSLCDLIEGRLSSPDGRSDLMKLATRLAASTPKPLRTVSRAAITGTYQ